MAKKTKRTVAQIAADKRRTGRPLKGAPRTERMTFRFTADEVEEIKASAKAQGVSVATYVIERIFGSK